MSAIAIIAIKVLAGGTFVCLFALISELLRPKQFAGLFTAAPSVALASLLVTFWAKGPSELEPYLEGMVAGAAAFLAYAAAAAGFVRPLSATAGSAAAILLWFAVAGGLYAVVLR
ncbi:MAG TPA: DUF3147 family protein [Solirubrobacterales bacterium]|nr:DUF3147 family protein [Solirubrobacterales bacterium]